MEGECKDVPFLFLTIIEYFECDLTKVKSKSIIVKLEEDELKFVDRLDIHVAFGDYSYIFSVQDPKYVMFYLKSVLKYMEEPLCSEKFYNKFKKISESLDKQPNLE